LTLDPTGKWLTPELLEQLYPNQNKRAERATLGAQPNWQPQDLAAAWTTVLRGYRKLTGDPIAYYFAANLGADGCSPASAHLVFAFDAITGSEPDYGLMEELWAKLVGIGTPANPSWLFTVGADRSATHYLAKNLCQEPAVELCSCWRVDRRLDTEDAKQRRAEAKVERLARRKPKRRG